MSTELFVYSATGNSLLVANTLSAQLGDTTIRSIVMESSGTHPATSAETVGFVFPIYFLGLPQIVASFIENIDLKSASYIFVVVTRGISPAGGAIRMFKRALKRKGYQLNAGWYITMIDTYFPNFKFPSKEEQLARNAKGMSVIPAITKTIQLQKRHFDSGILALIVPFMYPAFIRDVLKGGEKFTVSDACTSCGICEKACPVGNISMIDERPSWGEACQQCLACACSCPKLAISYVGTTPRPHGYRNPLVKLSELISLNRGK